MRKQTLTEQQKDRLRRLERIVFGATTVDTPLREAQRFARDTAKEMLTLMEQRLYAFNRDYPTAAWNLTRQEEPSDE